VHINDHYFVLYIIDEKIHPRTRTYFFLTEQEHTEMPAICVSDIDDFNNLIDVDSLVRKHGFLKDRRPDRGGERGLNGSLFKFSKRTRPMSRIQPDAPLF